MSKEMLKAIGLIAAASLSAAPVMAQSTPAARPNSGWVGITYSGEGLTDRDGNLLYGEYPVVVSVDPGSPAARAGVAAGDTIIAFNDRDVRRHAFPIRTMIQPGRTFVIRARRGNTERVARLVVAVRPSDRQERVELTLKPVPGVQTLPAAPFVLAPVPRHLRVTVPGTTTVTTSGTRMMLAGAEMRPLSTELAEAMEIRAQGLFVVSVLDATPAKESGLREGDVLLRAANTSLLTPMDLLKILQSDLDKEVRIDIVRKKKMQSVDLRW